MIVGVVGAGTMGGGIAQVALRGGHDVLLHDLRESLVRGSEQLTRRLAREPDPQIGARLLTTTEMSDLASCDLVIEAVPEELGLKHRVFAGLEEVVDERALLATNTSSIPVTTVAAGCRHPERVVGLHFFNPVPRMRLVEVIPGVETSSETTGRAVMAGRSFGKTVIVAADTPGFLVNRCGRPFSMEGLRMLGEGLASPEQLDRIYRMGGGFRMGPFELMDLVGVDVGYAVARSFTELSFGEPRWKPSPLQARLVASGRLGRKTGRGWFTYTDGEQRPSDPVAPSPGSTGGTVAVLGQGPVADALRQRAHTAGFSLTDQPETADRGVLVASGGKVAAPASGVPLLLSCLSSSLAAWDCPGALGFVHLPLAHNAGLVELTQNRLSSHADQAEALMGELGLHCEWVADAPGLVLGRLVVQLVNEALFAVGEGVASPDDVDTGVQLGLNYPEGSISLGRRMGWPLIAEVLEGSVE